MTPDAAYQQVPTATQHTAPADSNYARPVVNAPAPGMTTPAEMNKPAEKAPGMMYGQQPGMPMMPFAVGARERGDV